MKDLLEFIIGEGATDYWWAFIILAVLLYVFYAYKHTHAGPYCEPEYEKTMAWCRKFFYVYANIFTFGILQCIPMFFVGPEHGQIVNVLLGILDLAVIVFFYYTIMVVISLVVVFGEMAAYPTSPFDD